MTIQNSQYGDRLILDTVVLKGIKKTLTYKIQPDRKIPTPAGNNSEGLQTDESVLSPSV